MDKKNKDGLINLITEGLNEVLIPALENTEKRLKEELASKEDIDRIERKIDATTNRMDRHGKQLEKHEERIQTLETASL